MLFEEAIILLGVLGSIGIVVSWLFRILDYEAMVKDENGWRYGLMLFVGLMFSFALAFIGFYSVLTTASAFMFMLSGAFCVSVGGFFTLVEFIAFMQNRALGSSAYVPKWR